MKIKTSDLKCRALDFATAVADGFEADYLKRNPDAIPKYSESWNDCGEFIYRFAPSFFYADGKYGCEFSVVDCMHIADSFQEALCRCTVTFLLGREVDIPDELVGEDGS